MESENTAAENLVDWPDYAYTIQVTIVGKVDARIR